MESPPALHAVWAYDSASPIIEGAVSEDGTMAILRAKMEDGATELLLVDKEGTVTSTGQQEDAGIMGINILRNGLVVTGVQIAGNLSVQAPGGGRAFYAYQLRGKEEYHE